MNIRKFIRAENFVSVGALLIGLLAFASPVRSDTLPVVKAPPGVFKVRPFFSLDYYDPKARFDDRIWFDSGSDTSYALDALALDYIPNPYIRREIGSAYWCGTPTGEYMRRYGKPPEAYLRKRAARMEAKYLNFLANRYLTGYPGRPRNSKHE